MLTDKKHPNKSFFFIICLFCVIHICWDMFRQETYFGMCILLKEKRQTLRWSSLSLLFIYRHVLHMGLRSKVLSENAKLSDRSGKSSVGWLRNPAWTQRKDNFFTHPGDRSWVVCAWPGGWMSKKSSGNHIVLPGKLSREKLYHVPEVITPAFWLIHFIYAKLAVW